MSARDRTQLAALGFADPDKKGRVHDLACQYIYQPSIQDAICRRVFSDFPTVHHGPWVRTEFPLSKGEGRFRTTIGFLDVVFLWEVIETHRGFVVVEVKTTAPLVTGDVLRQMRLYQEYWIPRDLYLLCPNAGEQWCRRVSFERAKEHTAWVIATTFPPSKDEIRFLQSEGFHHVYLGDNFQRWIEEREDAAARDETDAKVHDLVFADQTLQEQRVREQAEQVARMAQARKAAPAESPFTPAGLEEFFGTDYMDQFCGDSSEPQMKGSGS